MPLENCPFCQGTGWKLVARNDAPGKFAVACDCGSGERAARTMDRARIPKRHEHCDFESYVTDLADGKVWTTQNAQSLKQAKLVTQGFVRDYPGASEKGLLLMGPSGVGKTHLAVAALKELLRRGELPTLNKCHSGCHTFAGLCYERCQAEEDDRPPEPGDGAADALLWSHMPLSSVLHSSLLVRRDLSDF